MLRKLFLLTSFVLAFAFALNTMAIASDIAFYVGQFNTDGWYGEEQFTDVETIIAETGHLFNDIQQFNDDDLTFAAFNAWVEANTDDGEMDIIWLNGCTPSCLYPNPNEQPDGSRIEAWLDGGNMVINVGDWFAYCTYEGGPRGGEGRGGDNGGNGAANILDLSSGIIVSADGSEAIVTPTGKKYLPSLGDAVTTDRPVILAEVQAPWEVAAIFASGGGTEDPAVEVGADPVVIHNTETGGYVAFINQASGGPDGWIADRGLTCAEFIGNWVTEVVGLGAMEIGFAAYPPVIDGQVDGIWSDASTQSFVPLEDPADGSGTWKVLYDAENLYVLVDMTDDSLQNDSSSSWQDDSVEIYFDGGNTKLDTPLSGDDHQYTFGWTTEDIQGTNVAGYTEGIEHAQVDTDTGWLIEVKMPWMSIWGVVPQAGDLVGIDCYYNDDDDGGDSREGKMLSFSAIEGWNDASQWGTAMLIADKRVDVTSAGDVVQGVPNDGDWPGAETPDLAIDDDATTKYLHFKGDFDPDPGTGGAGLQITPASGPTIVTGLTLTTANDVPGRDPVAFELSGSNESIDGPYELIASGDISDFAQEAEWPRFTMNETAINFANDVAYAHYQLIFTAIRGPVGGSVNSMQIAEVELLGFPGLVGYWKLDDGEGVIAVDSSGNGNDGTLEDGPTVVEGQFGQALAFDVSRIAIPASDTLTGNLFQGSFTLSAWINPTRTGNTWQQIFRSMISADTSNDTLFINNDGRLSWRGRVGGGWAGGMCETAPDVVPADQWTHFAVTGDGTNFRIYVSGALSQESAFQTTDGSNATYYIGGDPTWTGESFSGIVDEVRIYNQALSEAEIIGLATPAVAGLMGHWTLDDGSGIVAADSSGNGNDGIITDNPDFDDPTWITGILGGALEFHGDTSVYGSANHVECVHSDSLDITGPISIALWIRPDADDPEGQGLETAPMAKALSGASPSWSWQVRYGWGSPQPYMAFTFNTSPRAWAYVGSNLERGVWAHIACSHDGETLKCYLNGVETDSTPMGAITSSPTPVLIGSDGWGCDWIGAIDDVRIYDRALSEAEITGLAGN